MGRYINNFTIPPKKLSKYDILSVRHPQWILPRFIFDSERIVERKRGEWEHLTGKFNVVRPMPGHRGATSCFYIIAGNKPKQKEPYIACLIPEGWIGLEEDEHKYRTLFREWG